MEQDKPVLKDSPSKNIVIIYSTSCWSKPVCICLFFCVKLSVFLPIKWKSMGTTTGYNHSSKYILSFVFSKENKCIQIWKEIWVCKSWQLSVWGRLFLQVLSVPVYTCMYICRKVLDESLHVGVAFWITIVLCSVHAALAVDSWLPYWEAIKPFHAWLLGIKWVRRSFMLNFLGPPKWSTCNVFAFL